MVFRFSGFDRFSLFERISGFDTEFIELLVTNFHHLTRNQFERIKTSQKIIKDEFKMPIL